MTGVKQIMHGNAVVITPPKKAPDPVYEVLLLLRKKTESRELPDGHIFIDLSGTKPGRTNYELLLDTLKEFHDAATKWYIAVPNKNIKGVDALAQKYNADGPKYVVLGKSNLHPMLNQLS